MIYYQYCLGCNLARFLSDFSILKRPWIYYCLVMLALTAGGGILTLNTSLKQYEAMFIIPM